MEKIDSLGGAYPYNTGKKKERVKKKESLMPFSTLLGRSSGAEEPAFSDDFGSSGDESLEQLLDDVFELGEDLKTAPTLSALNAYKRSVKGLFRVIIKHSLATEQTISSINSLKKKKYTMIKVVDTKLESLAASVLSAQKENLDLLAKIDEIHGLLVDLIR